MTGMTADYARIRQGLAAPTFPSVVITDILHPVLMNLIGNAVKFTANGFVRVTCSVDRTTTSSGGEVHLKFSIQ